MFNAYLIMMSAGSTPCSSLAGKFGINPQAKLMISVNNFRVMKINSSYFSQLTPMMVTTVRKSMTIPMRMTPRNTPMVSVLSL